jgi:hypothetical protein
VYGQKRNDGKKLWLVELQREFSENLDFDDKVAYKFNSGKRSQKYINWTEVA